MKILFVCTGNICRSPLAEGILKHKLTQLKLPVEVDSCGFEAFHAGDNPDDRARAVALKRGIDISSHFARLFSVKDFDSFDKIYVMDSSHYNNVMRKARNESDRKKVDYIMNVLYPGRNLPVQDPWYGTIHDFEKVYCQLDDACESIVRNLATGKI